MVFQQPARVSNGGSYIISEALVTHSIISEARIPCLLYHHVGMPAQGAWPQLTVSPTIFAGQMHWLAHLRFTPITTAELLDSRRGVRPLPSRPVLLTFDDAYSDLITFAFPVLQRHRFPATIFVVTGHIGGSNEWDVAAGRPRRQLMSGEQIREWAARGLEFGAHSQTHPNLGACTASQLEQEIAGSRRDLEQLLDQPVETFAYPFGKYDERTRACVQRSFSAAFTCDTGLNDSQTDLLALRRMIVGPERPWLNHLFRIYRGRNAPMLVAGLRRRTMKLWHRE